MCFNTLKDQEFYSLLESINGISSGPACRYKNDEKANENKCIRLIRATFWPVVRCIGQNATIARPKG